MKQSVTTDAINNNEDIINITIENLFRVLISDDKDGMMFAVHTIMLSASNMINRIKPTIWSDLLLLIFPFNPIKKNENEKAVAAIAIIRKTTEIIMNALSDFFITNL